MIKLLKANRSQQLKKNGVFFLPTISVTKYVVSKVGSLAKGFPAQSFLQTLKRIRACACFRSIRWSFFICAMRWAFLCRTTLRLSLSSSSILNMQPHLTRSCFKTSNGDGLDNSFKGLRNCRREFLVPRVLRRSSSAICCRSRRSKGVRVDLTLNLRGRCLFLSCIAMCPRSQHCNCVLRNSLLAA